MVDAEHALDPVYARALGIYTDRFIISQHDSGEMALEIAEALIKSSAIDVLIIDSVAALVPRAEIDGEMGDSHIGLQARLMSQGLRKLVGLIKKNNCIVIFINQLREKAKEYLKENPEILKKIESQLYEKINSKLNEKEEINSEVSSDKLEQYKI